jgi:dynein heavy chain
MSKLKLVQDKQGNTLKEATAMWAKDGEFMEFPSSCDLNGQVEVWLNRLLDKQCKTVLHWLTEAVSSYEEKPREHWILDIAAQIALTGSQIWWTTEINIAFAKLEEGFENALKDYYKKQVNQLNTLITMLLTDLDAGDRQKIMTICTIDVHARDVVTKMITNKVFIIIIRLFLILVNFIKILRLKIQVNSCGNHNYVIVGMMKKKIVLLIFVTLNSVMHMNILEINHVS